MLGNGRAECYCYDGVTRLGHIRGKMRKKVWVSAGDIVLVGKRDYQDDKARRDVFHHLEFFCFRSHDMISFFLLEHVGESAPQKNAISGQLR